VSAQTSYAERPAAPSFDADAIRAEFPALDQRIDDKPLIYLDSAATALKPRQVIEAVTEIYARDCANIHRGVHRLSQRATDQPGHPGVGEAAAQGRGRDPHHGARAPRQYRALADGLRADRRQARGRADER
jgi:hypothetical protein